MALPQFEVQDLPEFVEKTYFSEYYGKQLSVGYGSGRPVPVPEFYVGHLDVVKDFKVRDDDIWILTYPKTGTTFSSEMIWLLASDLDYKEAANVKLVCRLTHIEFPVSRKTNIRQFLISLEDKPGPRVIRSHLPLSLLPRGLMESKAKIIYVTRDPRDTAISLFHHMREHGRCNFTLDQFLKGFLDGDLMYGSMFSHVSEFMQESVTRARMVVIRFEDMKERMPQVLRKLCQFLDKDYSAEELVKLEKHLEFNKMKENPSVNLSDVVRLTKERFNVANVGPFMRKGKVGSYKEEMPLEFKKLFDEKINVWDCKDIQKDAN